MTVQAVESAIARALRLVREWEKVRDSLEDFGWREEHTRYAVIDPIIRALGWKIDDPKECQPEYPRWTNGARVDYALFDSLALPDIKDEGMPNPDIIIEAKALDRALTPADVGQLQRYVNRPTPMTVGKAVLTNGVLWEIYELQGRRTLRRMKPVEVSLWKDARRLAAERLHERLDRQRWRHQAQA